MKLKQKFILFGCLSIVGVLANNGVQWWAMQKIEALSDKQQEAAMLIQKQMESDMMHDAMRGDVLGALLASSKGDAEGVATALKDFGEHAANFTAQLDAVNESPLLPDNIKEIAAKTRVGVDGYKAAGEALMAEARDYQAANAFLPEFEKSFGVVEEEMEAFSTDLVAWTEATNGEKKTISAQAHMASLVIMLVSLLLAMIVPTFAALGVFRPLDRMMAAMRQIAAGDSQTDIPFTERTDEVGSMARTAQVFKENLLKVEQLAREREESDRRAADERKRMMHKLADDFEGSVKHVVDTVASAATEMDSSAKNVANIAESSKQKLSSLTSEVDQASANVGSVASAAGELSAAINEINRQVARSSSITQSAVLEAQKADGTVQTLAASAQKIGEVVDMINSIAEQINLLALNATIEAARAGDAGKGFAVVASEVKALATQTTKATDEISAYIQAIQSTTQETVTVIQSVSNTIREINSISTTIAAAVEEQGVATQDIARNVKQAADNTNGATEGAKIVSTSANDTGAAAYQMTAASSELSRQAETLRHSVDNFLREVRAA